MESGCVTVATLFLLCGYEFVLCFYILVKMQIVIKHLIYESLNVVFILFLVCVVLPF